MTGVRLLPHNDVYDGDVTMNATAAAPERAMAPRLQQPACAAAAAHVNTAHCCMLHCAVDKERSRCDPVARSAQRQMQGTAACWPPNPKQHLILYCHTQSSGPHSPY
jgi:hypothetical protein